MADGTLPDSQLDRLNQAIAKEITDSGFAQVFTTELLGKKVLRLCIIHPETTEQDVLQTIHRLEQAQAIAPANR